MDAFANGERTKRAGSERRPRRSARSERKCEFTEISFGPGSRGAHIELLGRPLSEAPMVFVWARLLVLGSGWVAAAAAALIANSLLGVPELPTFLASGALWTCLLLLQ